MSGYSEQFGSRGHKFSEDFGSGVAAPPSEVALANGRRAGMSTAPVRAGVTVKHNYVPRSYFVPFHARDERRSVLVCHRRAGKTVAVVNDMVVRALRTRKKNWFGAYIAPFFGQAKQIAWRYLKDAVQVLPEGVAKIHESETSISFANGAKIRIFGADNADALRGLYFDLVVLDEVAQMSRSVWTEVIQPALIDRQGSAIFLGTPKGKNFFWRLAQRAQGLNEDGQPLPETAEKWFYLKLNVDDTKIIPEHELKTLREDLDDAEFNQEFMCSFDAAFRGSYYGKVLEQLEARNGITNVEYDPSEPVSVAMDVGHRDATAIWFWQVIDGEFRVFDYHEESGLDAEETCDLLDLKPYRYDSVWLPHDLFHKTFQSKKSAFDTFIDRGFPARRVPNPDQGNRIYHGIDAARKVLRRYPIVFDKSRCAAGIEALRNYSRKYDTDKQVFADTPSHDQWSHGADAFRYLALSLNPADVGRSVERAKKKRSTPPVVNTSIGNNVIVQRTLDDALREHDRRTALRRRYSSIVRY